MNAAIERSNYGILSEADVKELKKLYRRIVKALHPDLNPELSEVQMRLFNNAVTAYKNGDLKMLRIISEMVTEPVLPEEEQNVMVQLAREKERLTAMLQSVKDDIAAIKSRFPYTVRELLRDPEKLAAHKEKLMDILRQYEELIELYSEKIKAMTEG